MSKGHTLQDPYLNILRKERVPVSIYLVNGIKLQGQIESFDQFVVLLKNTVSQMVYKHAISTVVPSRVVRIPLQNPLEDEEDQKEWKRGDGRAGFARDQPARGTGSDECRDHRQPGCAAIDAVLAARDGNIRGSVDAGDDDGRRARPPRVQQPAAGRSGGAA